MPNYQNGKIYMIESKEGDMRYYGSTVQTLKRRLTSHKSNKKRYENGKKTFYNTSHQILDYDDYEISLVEDFQFNSRKELETRERWYIENNECVNKCIPTRTKKEYQKKYHQEHKQELLQQKKLYREKHKQELSQQMKLYREKHKQELSQKRKEKQKIKITCPCGVELTKNHIRRHERSIKHQNWEKIYNFIYL